eukprot:354132-Prorocentrum_minimum.AAC.2
MITPSSAPVRRNVLQRNVLVLVGGVGVDEVPGRPPRGREDGDVQAPEGGPDGAVGRSAGGHNVTIFVTQWGASRLGK